MRVTVKVDFSGNGSTKAWWAVVNARAFGSEVGGEVKDWLPRFEFEGDTGTAWAELPERTFIKVGAQRVGGYRNAYAKTPILIVEEGAKWEETAYDGTRSAHIVVENARKATPEDFQPAQVFPLKVASIPALIDVLEGIYRNTDPEDYGSTIDLEPIIKQFTKQCRGQ